MHIHGNSMNLNLAHLHSAGAAEKAGATQRAAEVRKKLLQGSAQIAEESDSDAGLMVGRWSEGGSHQRRQPDHPDRRSNPAPNDPEPANHPVSLWA